MHDSFPHGGWREIGARFECMPGPFPLLTAVPALTEERIHHRGRNPPTLKALASASPSRQTQITTITLASVNQIGPPSFGSGHGCGHALGHTLIRLTRAGGPRTYNIGTQPGVALNQRRAILLKKQVFLPVGGGDVSWLPLAPDCSKPDLTARVKRGRSHRRRRLATSFGSREDLNCVPVIYRTRESYAKAPPPPTSTLT